MLCKNCKHWQSYQLTPDGICWGITNGSHQIKVVPAEGYEHMSFVVDTLASFYCDLYEPKNRDNPKDDDKDKDERPPWHPFRD